MANIIAFFSYNFKIKDLLNVLFFFTKTEFYWFSIITQKKYFLNQTVGFLSMINRKLSLFTIYTEKNYE